MKNNSEIFIPQFFSFHCNEETCPVEKRMEIYIDSKDSYTTCAACGYRNCTRNFGCCEAIVRKAPKIWPEIICSDYIAITDKIAANLKSSEITGFRLHPLSFMPTPKRKRPGKKYWILEPTGAAVFKTVIAERFRKWICPRCGYLRGEVCRDNDGFHPHHYYVLDMASYDEADCIRARFDGILTAIVFSERIVDLARLQNWEDAHFVMAFPFELREIITIDHYAANWRELLRYDIAKRTAQIRLINIEDYNQSADVNKDIAKQMRELGIRDENLMPAARPEPIYDLHKPPEFNDTPAHPFEELSKFDGGGWQGSVECAALFGRGMFSIAADERYTRHHTDGSHFDDSVLPTKNQRKLFDVFIVNEQKILPELNNRLRAEIAREKPELVLPPADAEFSALASLLKMPSLFIGEPIKRNKGIVKLSYNLDNTNPMIDINVAIECDLKTGDLRLISCETEKAIRPDSPH